MKTEMEAKQFMQSVHEETEYYTNLWDSLTYDELQSMKRSNLRYFYKGRKLHSHFTTYWMFRVIRDLLPVIAIVGVASAVISLVVKKEEYLDGDILDC